MEQSPTKDKLLPKKKLPKPNNMIVIPTTDDFDFFKWWCRCMRLIVHLTDKEVNVVAGLLDQRNQLSKCILDPNLLDANLFSTDIKKKVAEECNVTSTHLNVVLSKFRERQIVKDEILNPMLVPTLREDDDVFQLLIVLKNPPTSKTNDVQ